MALMMTTISSHAGGKMVEPAPSEIISVYKIPLYIGIGLLTTKLTRDCPCAGATILEDTTYGVMLRAGWNINDYIGVEARYFKSNMKKDFSEVEHYGIYLKPQYRISPDINIYALVGYGKTTVDYICGAKSSILSESGLSYGGGIEYDITDSWNVWADAQHIFEDEGAFNTNINIGTIGIGYKF